MDMNQRQIALSLLESLREDLIYAHLNNGSRILDVADLRQYIYEQMGRIRTNALVMDGLYGTIMTTGKTSARKTGTMGKRTLTKKSGESDRQAISEMSWVGRLLACECGRVSPHAPRVAGFTKRARYTRLPELRQSFPANRNLT